MIQNINEPDELQLTLCHWGSGISTGPLTDLKKKKKNIF